MKPNPLLSYPQFGDPSMLSEDAHSSMYSYSAHEKIMETFHGLPRPEFEQSFIRPMVDFDNSEGSSLIYPTLYRQEPHVEWHQMHTMASQFPKVEDAYELSPSNGGRTQNNLFREPNGNFACEYTWPQSHGPEVSMSTGVESGFGSEHLLNSIQRNCNNEFTDLSGLVNVIMESSAELKLLGVSHSPTKGDQIFSDCPLVFDCTPALVDTSSSKSSDDGEGDNGDGNLSATEGRISDAPYAKLIYKALMEAPNHSMVLQDIYQWFIDNTEKGNAASAGWRNSIRHNLSMNAAFRKMNRKPNGDDTKRTSEWVLEPFAIKDGVTPTTRYRKNGKKTCKSGNLARTRVRVGRTGGSSSRKSKFQRQKSPDLRQDMMDDLRYYAPIQNCTPPGMGHPIFSPYTPDYHQPLPGSQHQPELSLDDLAQYVDIKPVQGDDGAMIYMDEHEHYGDRYPYVWNNLHYY